MSSAIGAGATIENLFSWCSPATVMWRVVPVVVDTIYRVCGRWARPHVSKKYRKRLTPLITDSNPAGAIKMPVRLARISATLNHALPRVVLGRYVATHRRTVRRVTASDGGRGVAHQASARSRYTTTEIAAAHRCNGAAPAATSPRSFSAFIDSIACHNVEPPKALPNKIDNPHNSILRRRND